MTARIVLVDDHTLVRDALRARLRAEPDFEVVGEAANVADSLECVAAKRPDVVVMDVNMPGGSGLLAVERIKKDWPGTRVLVLSGSSEATVPREVIDSGADGFVRKEDAIEEIGRAIRAIMAGKTYLSPEAATVLASALRTGADDRTGGSGRPELTGREIDVLKGIAEGITYKEIAQRLNISTKSVETYRARLARKLGCVTKVEMARYAVRAGLVKD